MLRFYQSLALSLSLAITGCVPDPGGTGTGTDLEPGLGTETDTDNSTVSELPPPPETVTVEPGDGFLRVHWTEVPTTTRYYVYFSNQSDIHLDIASSYHRLAQVPGSKTSTSFDNLKNGTEFYVAVTAFNEVGEGPISEIVSGTPVAVGTSTLSLNDTGSDWCYYYIDFTDNYNQVCYPGQDVEYGRDALALTGQLDKIGIGPLGFDFSKLDSDGNELPIDATQWACTRDNVTGLIWEIKSNDGGLRDQYHTYSWYNSDPNVNGGLGGYRNAGICSGSACDTESYVEAVNAVGLCGRNDWRIPESREYLSLNGALFVTYFPFSPSGNYWTTAPRLSYQEDDTNYVRLVSGAKFVPQGETECPTKNTDYRPSTPTDSFIIHDDGTTTHNATGLMWTRCLMGQGWDGVGCTNQHTYPGWEAALYDADESTFAGYSDWRLPNYKELATLIEDQCSRPAINTAVFRDAPSGKYLTSTPTEKYGGDPWFVNFENGGFGILDYTTPAGYVRLVRDTEPSQQND